MKREKNNSGKSNRRRHQNFIQNQNTCPLCNSELSIRVESYLDNFMLKEEASCPQCQVLTRVKDHKMH
jgi:hypothetical protein